ncbi:MAG: SagB family peptide dehydrogenase [Tepidisphaeraceae bacterium]
MTTLPRDILDRVQRVLDYHQSSKLTYDSHHAQPVPKLGLRPKVYRLFESAPKVPLPTKLLDAPVPTMTLLETGLATLPDSQLRPPQTLRTLATWLYMAYGQTQHAAADGTKLRTCSSSGQTYPCEVYVAALRMQDLAPGLYHFGPREFALRKLRDGAETLHQLKKGRPDLNLLNDVPVAMLVSTVFCRSSWQHHRRGYRHALHDAGHLVQNLLSAGAGLGIQTMGRLRLTDASMNELIGLPHDAPYGDAERVQAMVVWADHADIAIPAPQTPAPGSDVTLPPIARTPLASEIASYGSILAAHQDCIAPGVALQHVRPPLTDLAPLAANFPTADIPAPTEPEQGYSLRNVLLNQKPVRNFVRQTISRDNFVQMTRLAFRGGTLEPLQPQGPHVALVRPLWVVHEVTGMDCGVWSYNPVADTWSVLNRGEMRMEAQYLSLENEPCGNASAVCVIVANLNKLLNQGGPDLYRLAHLEAGLVAQRMELAARSLGLATCPTGGFYDDELRKCLGLERTAWEPLYEVAVGVPEDEAPAVKFSDDEDASWRD